jgi:hypothetical protein
MVKTIPISKLKFTGRTKKEVKYHGSVLYFEAITPSGHKLWIPEYELVKGKPTRRRI